jgi:hypothetical protein
MKGIKINLTYFVLFFVILNTILLTLGYVLLKNGFDAKATPLFRIYNSLIPTDDNKTATLTIDFLGTHLDAKTYIDLFKGLNADYFISLTDYYKSLNHTELDLVKDILRYLYGNPGYGDCVYKYEGLGRKDLGHNPNIIKTWSIKCTDIIKRIRYIK